MANVTHVRPAPVKRAGAGRFTRQERLAYTMLVPILGSIFLIVTYPFVLAVIQSLQATNGGAFVGLQNYVTGLENPLLYEALAATAVYAALVLPTEILLGLGLALAVHRGIKSAALRALFFGMAIVPLVIPPIAVGVIARLMYAPSYGAINHILMLTGITHDEINWLGQPITAMPAVASVDVWQWTPFVYLVLFSGFLTVPRDEIEAAQVDGASGWSQLWRIETLPKSRSQLFQATLSLFPEAPILQPYADVLIDRGMWILLRNSIVVCGATVVLALTVGLLITYPITRLDVSPRVRAGVLNWALSLRFLPPIAVVVPYFAVVRTVGLYDQPLALIFIYSLFNLPFTIWMLKGFLTEIPREIEEAAL